MRLNIDVNVENFHPILFKAHVYCFFNFKNVLEYPFVNTLYPLFNFILEQKLLTASKMSADSSQVASNVNNFLRYCRSSMRFSFVDTARSNKSVDYISNVTMFLELTNHGIWAEIFLFTSGYRIDELSVD